jgi:Ca2+-binding EF-hand superfamily protein
MRKLKMELLAGVAAIVAGALLPMALQADPMGDMPGRPSHEDMMKKLDTNKDGTISPEERKAAGDARFTSTDTNGDGFLSRDELMAAGNKRVAEHVDQVLAHADENKDGKISKAEYDANGAKMRERRKAHKAEQGEPGMGAPGPKPE